MEENTKRHFGLFTAISMIVGICIGSGIFFKADDILRYTGGNVFLGVVVLCIGAFNIVFGGISLTELSLRTEKNGGIVGYFEEFISSKMGSAFGWFQTFVYLPTITSVVAWVAGIYTCILLGINSTLEIQVLLGLIFVSFFYLVNIFNYRFAGFFQNMTTLTKLIPLFGIAIIGFFWTKSNPSIPANVQAVSTSNVGWGWLAALAPVAFSYDGWPVVTSITNEIHRPKRNMPLALIIGPLVVLGVYLSYFLGITKVLGAEYILSTGDRAIYDLGELLLGKQGQFVLLIFVIVSVLGVVNGIVLGSTRMPQALASKNMLPQSERIKRIDEKKQLSVASCWISYGITLLWMLVHYITQKTGMISGSDVSEIAIVFSYICYLFLYVKVIQMKKAGKIKSIFKGYIAPVFAIFGAIIIVIGGIISNPYMPIYILICLLVCAFGYFYYQRKKIE